MQAQKTVRSVADLAINGAPPVFAEPLHVGRPNIGDRDTFMQRAASMLDRRWLTNNGPFVQEFERRIADYARRQALRRDVQRHDRARDRHPRAGPKGEVIVPSYTFVATAHALQWQGITPVFADIDPRPTTSTRQPVERMITPRTTGIIGVHLWGRAAPWRRCRRSPTSTACALMFDAAHAFGCSLRRHADRRFGGCEVFSFHATKFFNTFEGGAVVTNDDELAEKMRLMRNFGFAGYDNVIYPGTNGKMTEISAAMGLTNLEALDEFIAVNRRNYDAYREAVAAIPGLLLALRRRRAQQLPVRRARSRAVLPGAARQIVAALHAENVLARKYFWPGCHRMQPYRASTRMPAWCCRTRTTSPSA